MHALLKTFGLFTLAATAAAVAQTPPAGPITSAEAAMRYHQSLEYKDPAPRLWLAAPAPFGAIGPAASGDSADLRLNQIVGWYTRDMLGRGAWFNPWTRSTGPAAAPVQPHGYRPWFDWPGPGSDPAVATDAGAAGPTLK